MTEKLTRDDILVLIITLVAQEGSQSAAARKIGISATYLGDILDGSKEPGPAVLKFLGIEREVIYRKK